MKKNRKSQRPANKKKSNPAPAPEPKVSRRAALSSFKYAALGVVAVGGIGAYAVTSVMADVAEQDLSVIGQGLPTVVQIHDPACPDCLSLQRSARAALEDLDEADIAFRIASLTSTEGQRFAREHGVGRVTLMLFSADGQISDVLTGRRPAEDLLQRFQNLIDAN